MTFGSNLHAARQRAGLSLRAAAARTALSRSYLSDLETGAKSNPSLRTLQTLAQAYKTSVAFLTTFGEFS